MMKAWISPLALAAMVIAAPIPAAAERPGLLFEGWNAKTHAALVLRQSQISEIAAPAAAPHLLSPDADVAIGAWAPRKGDVLVVQRAGQLYVLGDGAPILLTDGRSRNAIDSWSHDGHWLAYTSDRLTGTEEDIHVVDPRDPRSDRLVAKVKGDGWAVLDFTADGTSAVVAHRLSPAKTSLFFMDVASGAMRPIGDPRRPAAYGDARFSYDGVLWATSDAGGSARLGMVDGGSGMFTPIAPEKGQVGAFDVSGDGKLVAYVADGRLRLLDTRSGQARTVEGLPAGRIDGLHFAAWGVLGVGVTGVDGAADLYAIDPATLAVTRWTNMAAR